MLSRIDILIGNIAMFVHNFRCWQAKDLVLPYIKKKYLLSSVV